MSIEINWYVPNRILHVHVLSELGLDDVEEMARDVTTFMGEGVAPVHILLDDAKGGRPPISLKELKARLAIAEHPSIGWIVGVGEVDAVAKFLIPLLLKVMKLKYVRVTTLEEGVGFLSRHDVTLHTIVS